MMTITIDLTPEQESRLRALAAEAGQTVEEYMHDLIVRRLDELDAEEKAEQARKGEAK
jgi:predicted DNA-binding protein